MTMSSRRKQGRPQQRKTLDSLEQENDLLVCGDCQMSFPLQEIVQFIKHKKQACNKENHETSVSGTEDSQDGEGPKDLSAHKDRKGEDTSRRPLAHRQLVDAEANTTHTEPSCFVCEVCHGTLGSAWSLLQHAQKEHGIKIYNLATSAPSPQPQPAHTRTNSHTSAAQPTTPIVTTPSPRPSAEQRSTPVALSSGHTSPFPTLTNPFTPTFRMPLDGRAVPPYTRAPELSLPVDLQSHLHEFYRLRPSHPLGGVAVAIPPSMEPHFAHSAFDRSRSMSALETQIYSQRLKQLANTTLPPGLISPLQAAPFSSPVLTPLQPNARESRERSCDSGANGRESVACQESSRERDSDKEKEKSRDSRTSPLHKSPAPSLSSALSTHLPSKLKSCEFCGKMFRFQSNLIVHRRSHTGERPFRCPLCPHACTQQSKLKRHMKTHASTRNASLTSNTASSDGSVRSASSTPDSTSCSKLDDTYDDADDDDDDNDDDADEEEEMEADYTDGDYESGVEDEGSGESLQGDVKRPRSQACSPESEGPPSPSNSGTSASLVSEVMKNSGLNCIQSYNEAFQAALAEKFGSEKVDSESGDGNNGPFLGKTELSVASDRSIKREPGELGSDVTPTTIVFGRPTFNRWAGLHDASAGSLRTFFPGFPPPLFLGAPPDFSRDNQNGYAANSDSALKVPVTLPALSLTTASKSGSSSTSNTLIPNSNGGNVGGGGSSSGSPSVFRKDSKRNDTCEFCGKVFKNCSNLTVHRRSHTGEKPYKCSLCNYACAQSSKLTRHMKTHGRIGKDVFKCKFCLMPFSVPSTLEKHMRKCLEKNNAGGLTDKISEHMMESMMDEDNSNGSSANTQGGDEPLALDMKAGRPSPHVLPCEGPLDLKAIASPGKDGDSKNVLSRTSDKSPLTLMLTKNPLTLTPAVSPQGKPADKSPGDRSTQEMDQDWT